MCIFTEKYFCVNPVRHCICYCYYCVISRGDERFYSRGDQTHYGTPEGWCRFAMKLAFSVNTVILLKHGYRVAKSGRMI